MFTKIKRLASGIESASPSPTKTAFHSTLKLLASGHIVGMVVTYVGKPVVAPAPCFILTINDLVSPGGFSDIFIHT